MLLRWFHQVEILTYCLMGNHFHLLIRVPERPPEFDRGFEEVMALWEKAVGGEWLKGVKRQFEIFDQSGSGEAGREAWRQQMLGRISAELRHANRSAVVIQTLTRDPSNAVLFERPIAERSYHFGSTSLSLVRGIHAVTDLDRP